MTYTWEITRMKTADLNGVQDAVVQVYWTKTGTTESGVSGKFDGATPLNLESIDSEKFIPYKDLTEEIVIGWIQAVVVDEYETHVNARIQLQIDEKLAKEPDLPWKSAE